MGGEHDRCRAWVVDGETGDASDGVSVPVRTGRSRVLPPRGSLPGTSMHCTTGLPLLTPAGLLSPPQLPLATEATAIAAESGSDGMPAVRLWEVWEDPAAMAATEDVANTVQYESCVCRNCWCHDPSRLTSCCGVLTRACVCRGLAEEGDVVAQETMGMLYLHGRQGLCSCRSSCLSGSLLVYPCSPALGVGASTVSIMLTRANHVQAILWLGSLQIQQ